MAKHPDAAQRFRGQPYLLALGAFQDIAYIPRQQIEVEIGKWHRLSSKNRFVVSVVALYILRGTGNGRRNNGSGLSGHGALFLHGSISFQVEDRPSTSAMTAVMRRPRSRRARSVFRSLINCKIRPSRPPIIKRASSAKGMAQGAPLSSKFLRSRSSTTAAYPSYCCFASQADSGLRKA